MKYIIPSTRSLHLFLFPSFVVYVCAIIFIPGYREYPHCQSYHRFRLLFSRTITRDDSLAHEAKHVFRHLLATVIRRLQQVRFEIFVDTVQDISARLISILSLPNVCFRYCFKHAIVTSTPEKNTHWAIRLNSFAKCTKMICISPCIIVQRSCNI